ncbi:MAG: DNA polymerase III subunit delta [Eubacteriales bacterium]
MNSLDLIKNDIEQNNDSSVYLLYGEDDFLIREALKILKGSFLAEDPSGSSIELLSGKEASVDIIVEAANTASFFSRRLVIVDDIQYFNSSRSKKETEEKKDKLANAADDEGQDTILLQEYCKNPNPASCLVLISEKANKGRKLYKAIVKCGKVIEFAYPKRYQEWQVRVVEAVKSRGKTIKPVDASFLIDWVGHYTGIINQEISKLVLYVGDKKEIKRDDIAQVCVPMAETTIFAMVDAIASGFPGEAIKKLREVLEQEYYLKVLSMIVRQIRLILAACLIRAKGGSVEQLMEIAGVRSPFEANKIFRQASSFTPQKLIVAMEDCLKTEVAMKSSGGDPNFLLEIMVIKFCSK